MSARIFKGLREERGIVIQLLNNEIAQSVDLAKTKLEDGMSEDDKYDCIANIRDMMEQIQGHIHSHKEYKGQILAEFQKLVIEDEDEALMTQERKEDSTVLEKAQKAIRTLNAWLKRWDKAPVVEPQFLPDQPKSHNDLIREATTHLENAKVILTNEQAKVPELLQMDPAENDTAANYRYKEMLLKQIDDLDKKIIAVKNAESNLEQLYVQVKDTDKPAYEAFVRNQKQITAFCDVGIENLSKVRMRSQETNRAINEYEGGTVGTVGPFQRNAAKTVNLPKVPLKKFTGADITLWPGFRDSFMSSVDKQPHLPADQKFIYLKMSLLGDALKTIEGLQESADNYPVALDLLKDRYDNPQLIINSHYTAMSNMPAVSNDAKKLRQVYDEFETHLRSLDAMGEDITHPQFVSMIQSKLPREVMYHLQVLKGDTERWTVADMRKHFKTHLVAIEYANHGSKSTQSVTTGSSQEQKPNSGSPKGNYNKPMTGAALFSGPSSSKRGNFNNSRGRRTSAGATKSCIYCDEKHYADKCDKVTTLQARQSKLQGRCTVCFSESHDKYSCPSTRACYYCGKTKSHHSSLCFKLFHKSNGKGKPEHVQLANDTPESKEEIHALSMQETATTEHSLLMLGEQVIMQTALAKVKKPNLKGTCTGRMLLDSASNRTYVTEAFAKRCGLKPEGTEVIKLLTFGTKIYKNVPTWLSRMTFAFDSGESMLVRVNVTDTISGELQREPIDVKQFPLLTNLKLADTTPVTQESSTIDILLGADYYHNIVCDHKLVVKDNFFAIQSVFGWLLAGRLPGWIDKSKAISQLVLFGYTVGQMGVEFTHLDGENELSLVNPELSLKEKLSLQEEPSLKEKEFSVVAIPELSSKEKSSLQKEPSLKENELSVVAIPDPSVKDSYDYQLWWQLATLGVHDSPYVRDDDTAAQYFLDTTYFENGRYVVSLPWKDIKNFRPPENELLCIGRLTSLLARLRQNPELAKQYVANFREQFKQVILEKVMDDTVVGPIKHYIAHHGVLTPHKSSTKLRVVYDASAKTRKTNLSLNECLLRGPVMLESLLGILLRFRKHRVPLVADIEKAFLQIVINEPDRDAIRCLWLKDDTKLTVENNIQICRFTRVPFGVISSPALLAQTINLHLQKVGTAIALKIKANIYVDNLITGVDSDEEAIQFRQNTKAIGAQMSMNFREWASPSKKFMNSIPENDRINTDTIKVLGIIWSLVEDSFSISGPSRDILLNASTKRMVLSAQNAIFDPAGLLAPIVLKAKVFLQVIWMLKYDWDTPFTEPLKEQWRNLAQDLLGISDIRIPRFIGLAGGEECEYQLHCFSDASEKAFASVVYLRQSNSMGKRVDIQFAKIHIVPQPTTEKKKIAMPRLELLGAFIGVKAMATVRKELHLPISQCYMWIDATDVLDWLISDKVLQVFDARRIAKIKVIGYDYSFRYVATDHNVADIATKGRTVEELKNCTVWHHGPAWLLDDTWPTWDRPEIIPSVVDAMASKIKGPQILHSTSLAVGEGSGENPKGKGPKNPQDKVKATYTEKVPTPFDMQEEKYSDLDKLLDVTAFINRYLMNLRHRGGETRKLLTEEEKRKIETPSAAELDKAKQMWISYVQKKYYSEVIADLKKGKKNQLIHQLNLKLNEKGFIYSHGRYEHTELPEGTRSPTLLHRDAYFTKLLIKNVHERLGHMGVSHTLAQVRYEYWITQGRAAVQNVLYQCRKCRRHEGGPYKTPDFPQFPRKRVAKSPPFTYTGLDYLGPFYIKKPKGSKEETQKVWVCLFTCLAVRAIHLEIIEDMSAEQFLLCLRRFIARRGTPKQITSDNAAQFKVAKDVVDKVWQNAVESHDVQSYVAKQGIQWIFIVQLAPWMGGFYERLVGNVKRNLKKAIGKSRLTSLQLQTFLGDAEAAVNSRPLTYVGSDINSKFVLTPSKFLSLNPSTGIPEHDIDTNDPDFENGMPKSTAQRLLEIWNIGQKQLNQFWKSWSDDYLLSLRERYQSTLKHTRIQSAFVPKVGDVVLIKERNMPRGTWLMGKIQELHESADGKIRSATILLPSKNTLRRALNFLYPIEVPDKEPDDVQTNVESDDEDKEDGDQVDESDNIQNEQIDVPTQIDAEPTAEIQPTQTGRPIRKAAMKARQNLKKWLNPAEITFHALGSVVTRHELETKKSRKLGKGKFLSHSDYIKDVDGGGHTSLTNETTQDEGKRRKSASKDMFCVHDASVHDA